MSGVHQPDQSGVATTGAAQTRRDWTLVTAAALSVLVGIVLLMAFAHRPAPVTVGSVAPSFTAEEVLPASGARALSAYRGRVVLLNLWATWCGPCRDEMPALRRLQSAFDTTQFRVVAVSVDRGSHEFVREYARTLGMSFDVLHDRSGELQQLYLFSGLPGAVLIDRGGVIRARFAGAIDWGADRNRSLVRGIIAEAPRRGGDDD